MKPKKIAKFYKVTATFETPDWFPPKRFNNVWYNKAEKYLHGLKGVIYVGCGVVIIESEPNIRDTKKWVEKTGEKLERFFNRYKESKK